MNIETMTAEKEAVSPQMTIEQENRYIEQLRANPEQAKKIYSENARDFIRAEIRAGATLQEISRIHAGRSLAQGPEAEKLELARRAISGLFDSKERIAISEAAFEDALAELNRASGEQVNNAVRERVMEAQLGYQDANISDDAKKDALQFVRSSESGQKYANALIEMTSKRNLSEYAQVAQQMVAECKAVLDQLGIVPTPYCESKTWGMWDIAKQYHFLLHPEQADTSYTVADPIEDSTKHAEIVNRHIGWEAFAAHQHGDTDFVQRIPQANREKAIEYLRRAPKRENGSLSSKELAELGALIRI